VNCPERRELLPLVDLESDGSVTIVGVVGVVFWWALKPATFDTKTSLYISTVSIFEKLAIQKSVLAYALLN
jgi:hypothetical protein